MDGRRGAPSLPSLSLHRHQALSSSAKLQQQHHAFPLMKSAPDGTGTWIDAGVTGSLGAQLGLIHLPNAATGHWHLLKLLKQFLHACAKGLLDNIAGELQAMGRRLQS